ncbi:hypothetical protein C7271_12290 [filamentous cyanobacterium CCP5]|nr:hypothetical protein C7271_12290 [filamentous cyanobacterium CCP5]
MSHLYEAFVDIREYLESSTNTPRMYSERYEIDALSRIAADRAALLMAETSHPKASEYDVRVTRILH